MARATRVCPAYFLAQWHPRGYKSFTTRWSGGMVQVLVQVWAPACHLAISPKAVREDNRRFRGPNQRPSSWGRSPALLALVGRASTKGVSESLAVLTPATCSLEENMLPLLQYWLCSTVKKVLMLCRYRAATSHFFLHVKWNFGWNQREVVANQSSAHHFAQSFYQSLVSEWKYDIGTKSHVPNWILCKVAGLKLSKLTICTKLGNDVRRDFQSIATKVCSQIGSKWNAMFEGHVVTNVDRTSFDLRFEDFLSNLPL